MSESIGIQSQDSDRRRLQIGRKRRYRDGRLGQRDQIGQNPRRFDGKLGQSDGIYGTWLQIDQNGARNVFATGGFIVINVDALQLKVGSALIRTGGVDAMFIGNDFPKLQ